MKPKPLAEHQVFSKTMNESVSVFYGEYTKQELTSVYFAELEGERIRSLHKRVKVEYHTIAHHRYPLLITKDRDGGTWLMSGSNNSRFRGSSQKLKCITKKQYDAFCFLEDLRGKTKA